MDQGRDYRELGAELLVFTATPGCRRIKQVSWEAKERKKLIIRLKKLHAGSREVASWLRVLVLTDDWGSVPSTPMVARSHL